MKTQINAIYMARLLQVLKENETMKGLDSMKKLFLVLAFSLVACVEPPYVEDDTDAGIDCQCTSGACCDGCFYLADSPSNLCDIDPEYRCNEDGYNVEYRVILQQCDGQSAECDGRVYWSDWDHVVNCGEHDQKCLEVEIAENIFTYCADE